MKEMKLLENELVPVYETNEGVKVVNGRELHQVLQSGQDFSTWVKKRLLECDAEENEDFDRFHRKMEANNATMIDYIIKLDIAKEMAMLERNEKGKQVRKYFIDVEKKYKQNKVFNMTTSDQIRLLAQGNVELNERVEKVEDKIYNLENDTPLYGCEIEEVCNHVKRKAINILGGKDSEAYHNSSIRGQVFSDIYMQIKREYGLVSSYKSIKRKYLADVHEFIDCYELPRILEETIGATNTQISMA